MLDNVYRHERGVRNIRFISRSSSSLFVMKIAMYCTCRLIFLLNLATEFLSPTRLVLFIQPQGSRDDIISSLVSSQFASSPRSSSVDGKLSSQSVLHFMM